MKPSVRRDRTLHSTTDTYNTGGPLPSRQMNLLCWKKGSSDTLVLDYYDDVHASTGEEGGGGGDGC